MQARASAASVVSLAAVSWLAGHLLAGSIRGSWADALAFVSPGLLLAWESRRLPAGSSPARIGRWLLLVSALAFAAQGVFAFDPADPDAVASHMRALAWTLWWIAFAPGALMQSRGRASVAASALAVVLVCAPALLSLPRAAVPVAASVAALAWLAWWFAALSRGAA
jgi:hypothetical protein